jgi:hypothetical protein
MLRFFYPKQTADFMPCPFILDYSRLTAEAKSDESVTASIE